MASLIDFSFPNTEACQVFRALSNISNTEHFAKVVNRFQPLTIIAKRSILDIWQASEYALEISSCSKFHCHSPWIRQYLITTKRLSFLKVRTSLRNNSFIQKG